MPTSNGQVTSRDIRQNAVKTLHIVPEAVGSDELASMAATIEKVSDPVGFDAANDIATDTTYDTTWRNPCSVAIDIPTWAGLATLICWGSLQSINATGQLMQIFVAPFSDGVAPDTPDNELGLRTSDIDVLTTTKFETASSPGATVTVDLWAKLSDGSVTDNISQLRVLALFSR